MGVPSSATAVGTLSSFLVEMGGLYKTCRWPAAALPAARRTRPRKGPRRRDWRVSRSHIFSPVSSTALVSETDCRRLHDAPCMMLAMSVPAVFLVAGCDIVTRVTLPIPGDLQIAAAVLYLGSPPCVWGRCRSWQRREEQVGSRLRRTAPRKLSNDEAWATRWAGDEFG